MDRPARRFRRASASFGDEIMKHATLAIALTAAICTIPGCLTLGDTNEVYPPTIGRELTDLRMSAERGAMSPQEYEAKKAQILAGRRGAQPNPNQETFALPGTAQMQQEPQWHQQPEGFSPEMQMQMQGMPMQQPHEMQYQQQGQYAPEMQQQMLQQQMQQPQVQQLPAEGWH